MNLNAFSNNNESDLILFFHLHKCGGTTITNIFSQKYNFYKKNGNGNPLDENGEVIPFCNYDEMKLINFINETKKNKIDFIALEWQYFKTTMIPTLNSLVTKICVFREPYDRIVSNFNFDIKYKFTEKKELSTYINSSGLYTHNNYYTKIMSGKDKDYTGNVNETDYQNALIFLKNIDYIVILEDNNSIKRLFNHFNLEYNNNKKNQTHIDDKQSPNITKDEFKKNNIFDYLIYEEAKRLKF